MSETSEEQGDPTPRFWPGRVAVDLGRRRDRPGPFVMPVRHVPDAAARAAALADCGEAARPLLDAWTERFTAAAGDPAGLARDEPWHDPAWAARALRDLAVQDPDSAASARAARERGEAHAPVRPTGLHVLEDATYFLELARHGVDFALVGRPHGLSPFVIAGGPGEPPRLLDPAGPEGERHAAAVRALRDVMGDPFAYWESPAFRRLCGRALAVAEGAAHLGAILSDMALAGHGRAFLKSAVSKRGTWVVALPRGGGIDAMAQSAHAAMGHAYADLHAPAHAPQRQVLVQEFLPFTHEHRFLVAGHRIVASTASDRAVGVLDAVGRRLHPGVAALLRPAGAPGAYDRGAARHLPDRGLAARMARVAREAVAAFRREGLLPPNYCLDVGLSERGVLPIEVNTLHYCGIYAADWSRVAAALGRLGPAPARLPADHRGRGRPEVVAEAMDFILDVLCDGTPAETAAAARQLSDLAFDRDPTLARAMGIVARDRNRLEAEDGPVDPRLLAEARARLAARDA